MSEKSSPVEKGASAAPAPAVVSKSPATISPADDARDRMRQQLEDFDLEELEGDSPEIVAARKLVTDTAAALAKAEEALAAAKQAYAEASLGLVNAEGGLQAPALHLQNRRAQIQQRAENAARARTSEALGQLANHFRLPARASARRPRPLHPEAALTNGPTARDALES